MPSGGPRGFRDVYKRWPYFHIESPSPFLSSIFILSRTWVACSAARRPQGGVDLGRYGCVLYIAFLPSTLLHRAVVLVRCTVLWSRGVGKSVPVSSTFTHAIPLSTSPSSTNSRWTALRCARQCPISLWRLTSGITSSRGVGKISE
jgi:hypothetical protein